MSRTALCPRPMPAGHAVQACYSVRAGPRRPNACTLARSTLPHALYHTLFTTLPHADSRALHITTRSTAHLSVVAVLVVRMVVVVVVVVVRVMRTMVHTTMRTVVVPLWLGQAHFGEEYRNDRRQQRQENVAEEVHRHVHQHTHSRTPTKHACRYKRRRNQE